MHSEIYAKASHIAKYLCHGHMCFRDKLEVGPKLAVTIENHPCLEVLNNLKFTLCNTWVLVDVRKDHDPIVKDEIFAFCSSFENNRCRCCKHNAGASIDASSSAHVSDKMEVWDEVSVLVQQASGVWYGQNIFYFLIKYIPQMMLP
jgi:hypothetical protein